MSFAEVKSDRELRPEPRSLAALAGTASGDFWLPPLCVLSLTVSKAPPLGLPSHILSSAQAHTLRVGVNYLGGAGGDHCCIGNTDDALVALGRSPLGAPSLFPLMNNGVAELLCVYGIHTLRKQVLLLKLIFCTKRVTENQLIAYYSIWRQRKGSLGNGSGHTSAKCPGWPRASSDAPLKQVAPEAV